MPAVILANGPSTNPASFLTSVPTLSAPEQFGIRSSSRRRAFSAVTAVPGSAPLTTYHGHHRMTVKRGASLPARTTRASRPAVPADSGADAIVQALAEAGTRLIFGVPGGGPTLDVVGAAAAAGLRFILAHGETAAVIMAATCADITGAPGTVVVTRGPGLASAVNGIAHAALGSS